MNDLLAYTISNIKVALLSRQTKTRVPKSKLIVGFLECLLRGHYIAAYEYSKDNKYEIIVHLRFNRNKSVISSIKLISTRRLRIYCSLKDIINQRIKDKELTGKNLILTTSKGVLSKKEAFKNQVGGLVLCTITS